jgi:hypothetical protein
VKATLERLWRANRLTIAQLARAVTLGWVTQEEADAIKELTRE